MWKLVLISEDTRSFSHVQDSKTSYLQCNFISCDYITFTVQLWTTCQSRKIYGQLRTKPSFDNVFTGWISSSRTDQTFFFRHFTVSRFLLSGMTYINTGKPTTSSGTLLGGWSRHNDRTCEGRNGESKLVSDWELWTTYPTNFYPYGFCSFSHDECIHILKILLISLT